MNKTRKVVYNATREEAEEELSEFKDYPTFVCKLVESPIMDSKEVEGGRCFRVNDGKLCFS